MNQMQQIYRNLSVQLLSSKNQNNEILDYSSQADIATTTHDFHEDNMQEEEEDEQTEDDGPEPLVEDELENQDCYHLEYSSPHSKFNQHQNQQSIHRSQRTSIDFQCDKCSIAFEMIQNRDNQIKKLQEKVKRYEKELQKQKIQEEILNISLQKKQQSIDEKDRLLAQMSRKIHYFNTQAKIQSNIKQEGNARPQTQQAMASTKIKSSSIMQQFNDQKFIKRKDSSLMDKMKTVQLVQQEVLNLKDACVTKSQQAKAGEKLATVLYEIQQKRSSVQSQMSVNFKENKTKSSIKQRQSSLKQKKEDNQVQSHRSNQIQEEEINLPRQLYQAIEQQRKQSPMMQIEEEKKSEEEMNTSIYMEYKVPQQNNQQHNHLNFFQSNGQINPQQQKQSLKNQNSFLQNVSLYPQQSNFQKIRQMVEQRNQNKSQLFSKSSKLSQSGNNNQDKRQASDSLASDQIEQKNSLTAAKKEAQQRIVAPNSCKNNNLIHNMPAMKGTHLEDQFHFQIQKKMQFQSIAQSNQDSELTNEQNYIQKMETQEMEQTEQNKKNQKSFEMPLQMIQKKGQLISDSEEIQESQKRPNKPINRSEYGMGGRLSNRLSQCEQKEFITEKHELFTIQNQTTQQSNQNKLENTIQNPLIIQISDNQTEQIQQNNYQQLASQIKLDQCDPANILLSSQPGTTKSNIKIAFGISNSTARNNRLLGSNSRQIQDMMNSVMRRPKLDSNKNDDDELQNTSSFLRQQKGQNDLLNKKGESAKSRIAGGTERFGETDRDLMLDIDEEISKDSMTLPNKSMLLYSQIIDQNRQIKNHFIKNSLSFNLQTKYLPKEIEAVMDNKYFARNLIYNKKKADFDQIDIDRFEEQKVMNSDHLSGIQKSKNSFLIKNSNKTISRQLQQSPYNNERVMQTFQMEKNNMTISDLQLDQTLQHTGNKNFTISGALKRQQQQQVIINKNQGQGYNNLHSSRNSLTNSSLTRIQSAFSTNQKLFAHSKIQSSITRSEQKKKTSVISSQILKKKLQININSTERLQQQQNIVNKDQNSSQLQKKNQISDDSQRSSEIKKDFCNTFRTIKSNVSLVRSKSKRNQPFVKSLQSQDIQQLKYGKLSTSQPPKNFQKTNSLIVQSLPTQTSEFNQKVILTGLTSINNSPIDNDLKIFDDFMILGLDDNKFQNQNELIEIQNIKQRQEIVSHFQNIIIDNKIKIYEPIEPESLWSFTHNQQLIEKCSRRKVIKNFCFPEGVKVAKIECLKQIEDGLLVNYGINRKKLDNDSNLNRQDSQELFLQFGEPFVFMFTLNKEEQAKKLKKKFIDNNKNTQVEQDMVMPGLPQLVPQNFQYRPSSRAERDTYQISQQNSQQNSIMRQKMSDPIYNEDDQLDQNFDGFNNEPLMYCLCFRFDVLILKRNDDIHQSQESIEIFNNLQNKNSNQPIISKKDLVELINNENVYITQEAFCCMFSNNQMFDVHGQFMMKLYQLFSLQINDKIRSNDYSGLFSLSKENNLNTQLKQIIQEMYEIQLHPILRGKDAEIQMNSFGKSVQTLLKRRCIGRKLIIEKGNNFSTQLSKINFTIPLTIEEIVLQQNQIFYECIFKLMSSNDIVNLIKAILLEKTIIFVGQEHMLAQFILGFNSLISPFKWCFSLIPILPVALLDMLEAPVPLIVGITPFEYQILVQENILENDMDQKIWVDLQLNEITISNKTYYKPLQIKNLQTQLDQYLIDQKHSIYDPETCNFGNLYKSLKEMQDKDIVKKVKEIQKVIGNIVSKDIIEKLQEVITFNENEVSDQELKRMVQKCDYITRQFHHDEAYYKDNKWGDFEFINQFTKTQIFATLMDQFIDNKQNQKRQSLI